MPRPRSPDRDKAMELYLQSKGQMLLNEIADQLNLPEGTVRGWKNKDNWEGALKGTPSSSSKKNTERSKQNTERSNKSKKVSSINNPRKKTAEETQESAENPEVKTNTPRSVQRSQQRPENKNAIGNAGGPGGPLRNKHAVRTHEFETFYYDDLNEDERAFYSLDDCFGDKYYMQTLLIRDLIRRERRIEKTIQELKNTPGGMVFDSISKFKGTNEGSSHVAKSIQVRIMQLEDVLQRVTARRQTAVTQLHRMEINDEMLALSGIKVDLSVIKAEIATQVDIEEEIESGNFLEALEGMAREVWEDESGD